MQAEREWSGRGLRGAPLLWLSPLLVLWLVGMPALRPVFAWTFPDVVPPIYQGASLIDLFLSHAAIVAASSIAAILVGVGAGIFATREAGRDFRPLLDALATAGQTFPPVAVLAVAVPALGYGFLPTFVALAIYGVLPILANTVAGLEQVSSDIKEAARGIGLSPLQRLRFVELPLAAPVIVAGIRTSVIINIGTATLGSTIGADTLGAPIIDGLVADKLPYVLQGGIAVGLFAIVTDLAFERLVQWSSRYSAA
jgi:osmoprotectant transport system permease protein